MSNPGFQSPDQLTAHQELILDGFIAEHVPKNPQVLSLADQSSADLRLKLTGGFGLELTTMKEYYDVMVGVVVATTAMEKIIEGGLPPKIAGQVMRMSLGILRPQP